MIAQLPLGSWAVLLPAAVVLRQTAVLCTDGAWYRLRRLIIQIQDRLI
jgi:hypothetical protein